MYTYQLLNTRFAALKGDDVDALLPFFDPEVVIEMVDAPDPETYHGHDGVRSWFKDASESGPLSTSKPRTSKNRATGPSPCSAISLRGEASGVELELPVAAFHQFRSGRIVHDRVYLDRSEALEALGLSEQDVQD
jgi:ketosteroid isomerase-like protein